MADVRESCLSDTTSEVLMIRILIADPAPETCRLLQKAYPARKNILLRVDAGDAAAASEAGSDFSHKGAPPDELIATLMALLRKAT